MPTTTVVIWKTVFLLAQMRWMCRRPQNAGQRSVTRGLTGLYADLDRAHHQSHSRPSCALCSRPAPQKMRRLHNSGTESDSADD